MKRTRILFTPSKALLKRSDGLGLEDA